MLNPMNSNNLYVDLLGFFRPSIVMGNKLHIFELTVGYETNLKIILNINRINTKMLLDPGTIICVSRKCALYR